MTAPSKAERLERMVYELADNMMDGHTWEGTFGYDGDDLGAERNKLRDDVMEVFNRIRPIAHAEWEASSEGRTAAKQLKTYADTQRKAKAAQKRIKRDTAFLKRTGFAEPGP